MAVEFKYVCNGAKFQTLFDFIKVTSEKNNNKLKYKLLIKIY